MLGLFRQTSRRDMERIVAVTEEMRQIQLEDLENVAGQFRSDVAQAYARFERERARVKSTLDSFFTNIRVVATDGANLPGNLSGKEKRKIVDEARGKIEWLLGEQEKRRAATRKAREQAECEHGWGHQVIENGMVTEARCTKCDLAAPPEVLERLTDEHVGSAKSLPHPDPDLVNMADGKARRIEMEAAR